MSVTTERSLHNTEQSIDWKSTLEIVLGKSSQDITLERAFAEFMQDLRDLCPETKWHSTFPSPPPGELNRALPPIKNWIRGYIMGTEWPFPEHVMIQVDSENTWNVIFLDNAEVPDYPRLALGIKISTWSDDFSTGWKLTLQDKK